MKPPQHLREPLRAPIWVENGDGFLNLRDLPIIIKVVGIEYDSEFRLCSLLFPDIVQAHNFDFAAASFEHIENEFDGSGLAGAVWPN